MVGQIISVMRQYRLTIYTTISNEFYNVEQLVIPY